MDLYFLYVCLDKRKIKGKEIEEELFSLTYLYKKIEGKKEIILLKEKKEIILLNDNFILILL